MTNQEELLGKHVNVLKQHSANELEAQRQPLSQTMMSSVTSNLFKQNINQYTKAVPSQQNNPYISSKAHQTQQPAQNKSSTRPTHNSSLFAEPSHKKERKVPALNLNKCTPQEASGSVTHRDQLYDRMDHNGGLHKVEESTDKQEYKKYLNPSMLKENEEQNPFKEKALNSQLTQNTRYTQKPSLCQGQNASDEELSTLVQNIDGNLTDKQFTSHCPKEHKHKSKKPHVKKQAPRKTREEGSKKRHKRGSSLQEDRHGSIV